MAKRGRPLKRIIEEKVCLTCDKKFIPLRYTKGMYCSHSCSGKSKIIIHKMKCVCCGKDFEINDSYELKRGHIYCSNECRVRKFNINENFFNDINEISVYWMGFIWSTLFNSDYKKISLISNQNLLDRFLKALNSNYPVIKSINKKYRVKITSLSILDKLVVFGLSDILTLEFPDIPTEYHMDFIRGYFDSDNGFHYKDENGDVIVLHGKSSKLMKSISEKLKSNLVYSNGEWVSISFNTQKLFDGNIKLEEKWNKFLTL